MERLEAKNPTPLAGRTLSPVRAGDDLPNSVNSPAHTDDQNRIPFPHDPGRPTTDGLWRYECDPPIPVTEDADVQVERILRDGRLADCNDALARMYGLESASQLIGSRLSDFMVADDPRNRDYLLAFIAAGYRLDGAQSVERAADGSPRSFVNSLVGIVRDGMLLGAWGTQSDVTERMRMEQQARQADTIAALNRLAGGVAHDFNNLLTTILTSIDMLEDTLDPGHVARADASEIRRAARRGAELTRQLLALSQQQVLVPRPTDLNVIVKRATAAVRRAVTTRIDVRTRPAATSAVANVDGEELEQVLLNLATFAADSMTEPGFVEFEVSTTTVTETLTGMPDQVPPGSYVTITVTDSAPAYPSAEGEHLFEPFFGVDLSRAGSGLALATVRGFVKQSGGAVVLERPKVGRRLCIYLTGALMPGGVEVGHGSSSAPSSGTVLVAEDEPTVRLLMKRVLQRAGFVVLEAANGEEALDISRSYTARIDVLVTDVIMPGMGGGELSRRLRQERLGIKVLHVSGYTAGALRQHEALEDGAAFLQKPFTPKTLISRLREVMAG